MKARAALSGRRDGKQWEEKINQIRIYSGEKYSVAEEAEAGNVCAVTGLNNTRPGEGLGIEKDYYHPVLEPVLTYKIELPPDCDPAILFPKLRILEEEDPQLHLIWDETLQEIQAKIMGEVQTEVLKSLIMERFHIAVSFGMGNIIYKETIENTVEGVGHFEPLKHYAEVHLLLEPGETGSGLIFALDCSEDMLDRNWQRLVLTHLEEKEHKGVLTGAPITDMKITLIGGRAHQKHTEGGDFRQACYRAVRQGLMEARSVLLEPYYDFRLEVPEKMVGRAMADMEKMSGTFSMPVSEGETAVLTGFAPVASMQDYPKELAAYTKGHGRLFCTLRGYERCHNTEAVWNGIRSGTICMWKVVFLLPETGWDMMDIGWAAEKMTQTAFFLNRRKKKRWRKHPGNGWVRKKWTPFWIKLCMRIKGKRRPGEKTEGEPGGFPKTGEVLPEELIPYRPVSALMGRHSRAVPKNRRERNSICWWTDIILFLHGMI